MNRKSTPKVKGGRVQKKNNWSATRDRSGGSMPYVDRRRPRSGYRHLLRRRDIEAFIELLPDWDELSTGLEVIVLDTLDEGMGLHEPGAVYLSAWEDELWWEDTDAAFVEDHRMIFDRLGVVIEEEDNRLVTKWTEEEARAFQLLHVFLHELGHHHDRMTTRSRKDASRGERYAEQYATLYSERIWAEYERRFGLN